MYQCIVNQGSIIGQLWPSDGHQMVIRLIELLNLINQKVIRWSSDDHPMIIINPGLTMHWYIENLLLVQETILPEVYVKGLIFPWYRNPF